MDEHSEIDSDSEMECTDTEIKDLDSEIEFESEMEIESEMEESPKKLIYDGTITLEDIGQSPLHAMYYGGVLGTSLLEGLFLQRNDPKLINYIDSHGVSSLHLYCASKPDLVKVLLDLGVDANSAISFSCPKNPGFTPLHFAVTYKCKEAIELLLKNGADCNIGDKKGSTALHLACGTKGAIDGKIIDLLLEFGASPAATDGKGVTPLHRIFYKTEDLRDSIIDKFCSKIPREINFTDDQGLSHFHIVCARGDASRVSDFLESGVAVDSCVYSGLYGGYAALHFAVLSNKIDVVELLLQKNAQINVKTRKFHLTPLHIACKIYMKFDPMDVKCNYCPTRADWASRDENDLAIIELLLQSGADVEAQDSLGQTPLIQTCTIDKIVNPDKDSCYDTTILSKDFRSSQKKLIKILLENNADIYARAYNMESVLHAITKSDLFNNLKEDLVEFLIMEGADVNVGDATGLTPLHLAVQFVDTTLVDLFLKYQSNVNETEHLSTPLEMAINNIEVYSSQPTKDIILALLEHGAKVDVVNEYGRTLLEDAVKNRMVFVVEKLLQYGADLNAKGLRSCSTASFLKQWHRKVTDIELVRVPAYGQIVQIIFVHIQKLFALGLSVDRKIQKWCIKLLHRLEGAIKPFRRRRKNSPIDFIMLMSLYENCVEELERMKLVRIDRSTTLYDVLFLEDPETLWRKIRSRTFAEVMEDQEDCFPLYSYLLNRQLTKASKRRNVMEKAKTSINCISGIYMPDPCSDAILEYLNTREINDLNIAIVLDRYKRKRCDELQSN